MQPLAVMGVDTWEGHTVHGILGSVCRYKPLGLIAVTTNSDVLMSSAVNTMILLAVQYCAQTPLSRKFFDDRANWKVITMVEEVVKFGLSASFFVGAAVTPTAVIAILLLAVQYWAQPPLTRKFLNGRANKEGIAMVSWSNSDCQRPSSLDCGDYCTH